MNIKISDCKKVHFCSRGIRAFFDKYGLDYTDFIKNGIDSEVLLEKTFNDSMAKQVVEHKRGRF